MSGSALNEAKKSAIELINNLDNSNEIAIVAYSSNDYELEVFETQNKNIQEIIPIINNIISSGSTSFISAFNGISKILNNVNNKQNISIIFFTDGEDTSYKSNIDESLNDLINLITTKCETCRIHCLGFTKQHDVKFLKKLVKSSPIQGTFQYIENISSFNKKLNNLLPLITSNILNVTLQDLDNNKNYKILLSKNDNEYNGNLSINNSISNNVKLIINYDKDILYHNLQLNKINLDDFDKLDIIQDYISKRIISIIDNLLNSNISETELNDIKVEFDKLENVLELIKDKGQKSKRLERKLILNKYFESKQLVSNFFNIYKKKLLGTLENNDIARILDIAYSGNIKKSFQKKIDQRAIKNGNLFEKITKELTILGENNTKKEVELRNKYSDMINKIGTCIITTYDVIDLIKDGDCMCLSLTVTRPQTAIVDPTKLRIIDIKPTMISASAYYDAYESAKNNINDETKLHGGFNNILGIVMKGMANEEINAVIPLYLFEEHWEISKKWMKMILGLITTLDPLGYSYEQMITIPFMILSKALHKLNQNDNEYNKHIFELILHTCQKIYQETSLSSNDDNLHNKVKSNFDNYLTDNTIRTTDIIKNNRVFLMQIYTAQTLNLLPKIINTKQFTQIMIEEEMRRTQKNHKMI